MKRKLLILSVLAICLAILAAGTFAYFTSEDTAHNVITTGGVKIAVQEWADEEKTTPFEDLTGVMPNTTVTKIAEIKNTGASDAWVRVRVEKNIKLQGEGTPDTGLVELTRKKIGRDIGKILLTECPACHGNAYTPSADFLARKIKCRLKRLFADGGYAGALVTVHASHFNHMFQSGFFTRECETEWADKRIYIVPSASVRPQEFIVHGVRTAMMNLPPSARLLY